MAKKDDLLYNLPSDKTTLAKLYSVPRRGHKRKPDFPDLDTSPYKESVSAKDQAIGDIRRQIGDHSGDEKVAKSIYSLQEQFPRGTVPELLAYHWLQAQQADFSYQSPFGGGRQAGGMMPDFIVRMGSIGLAWLVQGSYYHGSRFQGSHGQQGRDIEAELRLKGQYVGGVRVESVVSLKEDDLYDRRPEIFLRAMGGHSLSV